MKRALLILPLVLCLLVLTSCRVRTVPAERTRPVTAGAGQAGQDGTSAELPAESDTSAADRDTVRDDDA